MLSLRLWKREVLAHQALRDSLCPRFSTVMEMTIPWLKWPLTCSRVREDDFSGGESDSWPLSATLADFAGASSIFQVALSPIAWKKKSFDADTPLEDLEKHGVVS